MKYIKRKVKKEKPGGKREERSEENLLIMREQKAVILELKEELRKTSAELDAYKNRENLITQTLKAAELQAQEMKRLCDIEYAAEIRRLNEFKKRWNAYFDNLRKKHNEADRNAMRILAKLNEILLKNASDKEKVVAVMDETERMLTEKDAGNEAAATQSFALDMSRVLNPGELDLEELCKEMGLMEE